MILEFLGRLLFPYNYWDDYYEENEKEREEKRNQKTIMTENRERILKNHIEQCCCYCKFFRVSYYDHWQDGMCTKFKFVDLQYYDCDSHKCDHYELQLTSCYRRILAIERSENKQKKIESIKFTKI